MGQSARTDDRAVSELTSVLTLLVIAGAVVFAVGLNVVLVSNDTTDHPDAVFTFDYSPPAQALLITHDSGEPIKAGNLLIRGPEVETRWSEVNPRVDNGTLIGPTNTTQISRQNAYGERVRPDDRVAIVYVNASANQTAVLSQWNGTDGFGAVRDPGF